MTGTSWAVILRGARPRKRARAPQDDGQTNSPPSINRDGFSIFGAHDAPVAVGLAADHNDVDLLLGEVIDQLVVLGLEPGRHRLLAECRPWVHVILHQLE